LIVRQRGAAGGLMITRSHNPISEWHQYKASYGSSALPRSLLKLSMNSKWCAGRRTAFAATPGFDQRSRATCAVSRCTRKTRDWKRLRDAKFRFVFDPMHGSAAGLLPELFGRNGIHSDEIRGTRDPRFGGVHPEPIEPHIEHLRQAVRAGKYDAGFCATEMATASGPSTATVRS